MDFTLSDERRMLVDTLDRLLRDRYSLVHRGKAASAAPGHDPAIWRALAETGVIGALFAERDGGFGGDPFDIVAVFETAGKALLAEPLLSTLMAGRMLAVAKAAMLERVIAGDTIVAFAHDEPDVTIGDVPQVTTARRSTGGGWVLEGRKTVVHGAEAADTLLVSAACEDGSTALLLVPASSAGVSLRGYATHDGMRAADVRLAGVELPEAAALLSGAAAADAVRDATNAGVLALCAEALGIMGTLIAMTREYLATRIQFGAPIGRNQALQHRMADLLIEAEQARSAVIIAAAALQNEANPAKAIHAAKYTIGVAGELIGEEAIQLHGGIGMTEEFALSHFAKRLILIDQQLGDADHHLARYAEARAIAA